MTRALSVRVSPERPALAPTMAPQIERQRLHLKSERQELQAEHSFREDGYRGATRNRKAVVLVARGVGRRGQAGVSSLGFR